MKILVTGAAGFIGAFTSKQFIEQGHQVIGIDNLNDYYDIALKHGRLEWLNKLDGFEFIQTEIADRDALNKVFADHKFDRVVHLAAQAGVRYSIENPHAYADSNLVAFVNILEACRHNKIEHLVYASSSSVYGLNSKIPYATSDRVDHPVSLYAATKKSNELMAHTYSHLYGLPTTGLRFFTVYGPWGRPDMAYFSFTKKILAGETIDVYNHGKMQRDFTYIDDIVKGVIGCLDKPPAEQNGRRHAIYNIGNNRSEDLMHFIGVLEQSLGQKAEIDFQPMQPGDVKETYADIEATRRDFGFEPSTTIDEGLPRLVAWYRDYYGV